MDNDLKQRVVAARTKLWLRGDLSWKLDNTQSQVYNFYKESKSRIVVWNISRRVGKTYTLMILAIEECIKHPNTIIKYILPQQKMARQISKQIMREITIDSPPETKPEYKTNENIFAFPNGSEIQLAGTDNGNHEKLRGGASQMCIVDEAGFCSELGYVVRSVLMPTTITTGGKILLSSTPPKSPDHEFVHFVEQAGIDGSLITKTIYDAIEENKANPRPGLTYKDLETYKSQYPSGDKNTEFQREYLCRIVTEASSAVIPELTPEIEKDLFVDWMRPPHYDTYVSMDIGVRDLTVVLFGYYDFKNNVVVIEDEFVMNGNQMTTDKLARAIKEKELKLWYNSLDGNEVRPYKRVSDHNLVLLNDLRNLHGLNFYPVEKTDKTGAINKLRMMIDSRQLVVNPKCNVLRTHLKHATWDKNKNDFTRSADNGHYDALMACVYLVRSVNYAKNPYPAGYGLSYGPSVFNLNKNFQKTQLEQELSKLVVKPRKHNRFNK